MPVYGPLGLELLRLWESVNFTPQLFRCSNAKPDLAALEFAWLCSETNRHQVALELTSYLLIIFYLISQL